MQTPHTKFFTAIIIGVLTSVSAYALPLYVSTNRIVDSQGVVEDLGTVPALNDSWFQNASSNTTTGNFNNSVGGSATINGPVGNQSTATGNAGQNTTIAGNNIFGSGSSLNASVQTIPPVSPTGNSNNQSFFQTVFTLNEAHLYSLTGALTNFILENGSAVSTGVATFLLQDSGLNDVISFSTDLSPTPVNLNSNGLLGPDQYTLTIEAQTQVTSGPAIGFGLASSSFNFDLGFTTLATPVPEPSTFLLLGTGLLGLVGIAQRRNKRA